MTEPTFILNQKFADLLEKASENAFRVMCEQMETNPDAIEALYGG
jgi:hypothetical protein